MAKLYIVGTPIGNMGDLTRRAEETLRAADVIACEDTRHSRPLLAHIGAKGQLVSYHKFNEAECALKLAEFVENGKTSRSLRTRVCLPCPTPARKSSHFAESAGSVSKAFRDRAPRPPPLRSSG